MKVPPMTLAKLTLPPTVIVIADVSVIGAVNCPVPMLMLPEIDVLAPPPSISVPPIFTLLNESVLVLAVQLGKPVNESELVLV